VLSLLLAFAYIIRDEFALAVIRLLFTLILNFALTVTSIPKFTLLLERSAEKPTRLTNIVLVIPFVNLGYKVHRVTRFTRKGLQSKRATASLLIKNNQFM